MSSNNKLSLKLLIILCLLLFVGCKEQVKELTLEEKIALAVESRKIPTSKDQKINFTIPESLIGRGPQITEVFSHMENYIPTILIEKGNTKTAK
ncbi:MAG: hypothetical protein HKP42_09610, partial [Maribacter sp.]|nr:hypothetical protein [Croceitalea sp.]NNK76302.1 hypothetical protein [Maribacter sp.]